MEDLGQMSPAVVPANPPESLNFLRGCSTVGRADYFFKIDIQFRNTVNGDCGVSVPATAKRNLFPSALTSHPLTYVALNSGLGMPYSNAAPLEMTSAAINSPSNLK